MTLELIDGSYITPLSIFDALDTVEEYMGIEMRQYLESYFMDGEVPVSREDHLAEVLEGIEEIAMEMEQVLSQKQMKKKDIQYNLDRIRATIRHEIGEK